MPLNFQCLAVWHPFLAVAQSAYVRAGRCDQVPGPTPSWRVRQLCHYGHVAGRHGGAVLSGAARLARVCWLSVLSVLCPSELSLRNQNASPCQAMGAKRFAMCSIADIKKLTLSDSDDKEGSHKRSFKAG